MNVEPLLYRASSFEFARFGIPQIKRQHNVFPICLSLNVTLQKYKKFNWETIFVKNFNI
jgi:hypothetical protein